MFRLLRYARLSGTTVIGFVACIWLICWFVRPDLSANRQAHSAAEIEEARKLRDVSFDPAQLPSLHRHVVIHPTGEAPMLADMERAGQLPPLKDRLPAEPIVMEGEDGIGKYGGTWMRLAVPGTDIQTVIAYRLSGAFLVRWSPLGYPIEPHIAKSITASDDKRVWTVELRPGLKWSDGEPYTADDIMYWWDHEANEPLISSVPPIFMIVGGKCGRIEKIDTWHVRFIFDEPYGIFLETLTTVQDLTDTPAHYLRKYHPVLGDPKLIEQARKAYQLPSNVAVYTYMKALTNPECPRLWPWIYRRFKSGPSQAYVRNPYYYVVDPAGNQLPYIDRLQFETQDPKMLVMTTANGGASMQDRSIPYSDYTELMSRRPIAGTRILHWYPSCRSLWAINPNLNRLIDPNDPSTAKKAKLLADKRFRQALSLAIDRAVIIRAEYNGQGEPAQVEPGPESPFHSEKLARAFVEFDPKRANSLLDEIGLTQRDDEGYRTFADGSRMSFFLDVTPYTGTGPGQFVVDDWAAVGVRTVLRERNRELLYADKDGMNFDFNVWGSESDYMPMLSPRYFFPSNTEAFYAVGWGRWYELGGFYNNPASQGNGCIPIPKDSPMYESMVCYEDALRATNLAQQQKSMSRIMDIAAENVWTISIATAPPMVTVVSNDMHNVPAHVVTGSTFATPANTGIETYYFDHPHNSPGAIDEAKQSILRAGLRPGGDNSQKPLMGWLRILPTAVFIIVVIGLAIRYPFLARRLAIMVPMLLVISVIIFTIIQLPPGDFLTARISVLEQSGDPTAQNSIDELRTQFHFEEHAWQKYARWMGFHWFITFDSGDTGILQGNLGRSMETSQPVSERIGDALPLTIIMSLGTILLTWAIAIPIGIYSAVRQYSLSDYVLTLIGFIGMCVPAFLLALVLMAASGVTGLFSPEFAASPEWTAAKVMDLLKHLWLPVVVLGIGGTAGMIRIMRANLLDELRKPYVVTAMAKGVRPFRLLMKYPVRLSLNPFISGIGALFPQLISGGAIVSVVLSLPTIGPMMLDALRNQDMYLAGSLLMVLNVLSVLGTLVSDLLLLWVDPRIRFVGGTR